MHDAVDEDDDQALLVTQLYKLKAPDAPHPLSSAAASGVGASASSVHSVGIARRPGVPAPAPAAKGKLPEMTVTAYDPRKRRLYFGTSTGELYFWVIDSGGAGTVRYVGCHAGPISAICAPMQDDGSLGKAGLLLSGSVDGSIKVWDYQVRIPCLRGRARVTTAGYQAMAPDAGPRCEASLLRANAMSRQ